MNEETTPSEEDRLATLPNEPGAVGRPSDMTLQVVTKLIAAFNNGLNITEAVRYSGISRPTYYRWLEADEWFRDKMTGAQEAPNVKAKEVIVQSIQAGNTQDAKWWLERKDPEFRNKGEMLVSPGQIKTEEKLKEFMDDTDDGAYPNGTDDVSSQPATAITSEGGEEVAPSTPDIS